MTTRFDPETGERLFTETQLRQIVKEAIDVLREQTLGHQMLSIVDRVHGSVTP